LNGGHAEPVIGRAFARPGGFAILQRWRRYSGPVRMLKHDEIRFDSLHERDS